MKHFDLQKFPHKRFNLLTGEWILVSPHRAKRPWQGKVEKLNTGLKPQYDPECYLCPGNERAGGIKNPDYKSTFVFDNDFRAILPGTLPAEFNLKNLLIAKGEPGTCRVVCFSPRHDLTLADMEVKDIKNVVDVWQKEYDELGGKDFINYVQIFENKGELMGCSNPHPHGQIWAQYSIPVEPQKEMDRFLDYHLKNKSCLLCDYLKLELELKQRIIYQNESFVVLIPFWAVWPFEAMIVSRKHLRSLKDFGEDEKSRFAEAIKSLTTKYDRLLETPFPYSSGIHQAPTDGAGHDEWHFHMHFYPPLLRSATVKKFMVGYEMLANPQRDITPELSAERLRATGENS
ncbi:MAG: UDP-glucose--hexose-1-phosphate uridylyltransferase [Bacteroidetes bacterium]|nr:UDP-glucose--hexose-1-phosphate uridylyltransferase [Bacteroidota bacterium]